MHPQIELLNFANLIRRGTFLCLRAERSLLQNGQVQFANGQVHSSYVDVLAYQIFKKLCFIKNTIMNHYINYTLISWVLRKSVICHNYSVEGLKAFITQGIIVELLPIQNSIVNNEHI